MSPSYNPDRPGPEDFKAARIYHRHYSALAVIHLARHDPVQLLKNACDAEGDDFYSVMAANDPNSENDAQSHTSSRRRTLSTNSLSPITSSASVVHSSSGSSDSSSTVAVWICPDNGLIDCTSLKARRLPRSNSLIKADIVTRRWKLTPKYLSGNCRVRNNHEFLDCDSMITLDWAWSSEDLTSGKSQQNIFYLVENLPGSDMVLGNSDAPESSHSGRDIPTRQTARLNSYGASPLIEPSPPLHVHGPHLRHIPGNRSFTENSTTPTLKPKSTDRSGRPGKERPQSPASETSKSKIPTRRHKASSVASASTSASRPLRTASQITLIAPPPPLGQAGATSTFMVTVVCEGNEKPVKLELDVSGEIFLETLKPATKKMRWKLDPKVDSVRFSPHKNILEDCCWMSLDEDTVAREWENARDWFNRLGSNTKVYAVIERDDGDDD